MKRAWIGLATVAGAIPAAAAAQSDQSVPPGVGVADRARPEFDAIGARIGGLFVYPRVDATAVATDNVLALADDRTSDLVAVARPSVSVRSDWSRHRLTAEVYGQQSVHARLGLEDTTQYGATLDGTYDLSRRTAVRLTAGAEHLALDRMAYNNVAAARSPVRFDRFTANVGVTQDFNRLSVFGGSGVRRSNFADAVSYGGLDLDQDFRDFVQVTVEGGARYRFGAGPSLIGRITVDHNDYDLIRAGVNRDSRGIKAEGGFAFDVSSLLYGEIRVGYIRRDYRGTGSDASGPSFGANVLWNLTPLTSVRFRADRSFEESRSPTAAANLITQIEAGADHELLRYVVLSATARYAHINPVGGTLGTSDEYGAVLRARYLVDRQLQLLAGYQFAKRSGVTLNQPFTLNMLSIGLRYTR